ncbi:alpha/beta hydrolase fold [Mycolicibacterium fortuitum subsp. acetamidolyticum]|uniref:Alpha/beta hydrolase fold n=1 Tax=Mycolicibacterium fortuitum subsp. acetamidolyticum TaxID=144550 RepID=A0A117IF95_MYCFO|nr:alpha/beta hydrolase fold [Mycolicibacterium fortuitum subsp. acetamidolyticum]
MLPGRVKAWDQSPRLRVFLDGARQIKFGAVTFRPSDGKRTQCTCDLYASGYSAAGRYPYFGSAAELSDFANVATGQMQP